MRQRRRQVIREREPARAKVDGRLLDRVLECEDRRLQSPGSGEQGSRRAKHGGGGEPEALGEELVGYRLSITEITDRNEWHAQPVAADVLQILDPEVTGDPKLIAGQRGPLRTGRRGRDADR